MKQIFTSLMLLILLSVAAQVNGQLSAGERVFTKHADDCLRIMEQAALKMQVKGVAVVAFIPGDTSETWISKMKVAGSLSNEKANYLAVAYSKAAEMAETFQNSGSGVREPKLGEFGWQGGAVKKVKAGYLLATFSGATGEQDLEIANKGLDCLQNYY
jgi:uncharacterized protein GlcG (DUF336 family)